jgi:threonine/homoserine/homoserine lactone efflux protein
MTYLIFGITYAFAAAVQPGPFQAFIISQTLSKGWRSTLPASFAPMLSDAPIITLVLLVLSNVPDIMVNILQLAGGLFLLYLAYGAYKSWLSFDEKQILQKHSSQQTLFKAAIVNLLNPNPYIGWSLIMGPLLIEGWRETPANGIALILGFYISLTLFTAGIIILFAAARKFGPKVSKISIGISALALGCFGVYQIYMGINILFL